MGNIVIPGFPAGMLVPGIYLNVELGRQPPSAAGQTRKVLLVGQNEAGQGSADPGKVYRISKLRGEVEDSAETLFGTKVGDGTLLGSRLFWMAKAAFDAYPFVPVNAVKVIDSDPDYSYSKILSATDGPAATQRFHYIVVDSEDQVEVGLLKTYLEKLAEPKFGLRQQGVVASGKISPPTIPLEVMSPRLQFVTSYQTAADYYDPDDQPQYPGYMLASAVAAMRGRHESVDPAVNLCMEQVVGVPSPPDDYEYTKTQLNAQLAAGYTPLVPKGSEMLVLRSVTTAASVEDNTYPVLDTTKVTVTDFVADDIEVKMVNRYTGFKLAPDTDLPPPSRTATPKGVKSSLLEWLYGHEKAGRITLVQDLADRVKVEIDPDVDGRVNFQVPEDVIEIFAVGAGNIIQIG